VSPAAYLFDSALLGAPLKLRLGGGVCPCAPGPRRFASHPSAQNALDLPAVKPKGWSTPQQEWRVQ